MIELINFILIIFIFLTVVIIPIFALLEKSKKSYTYKKYIPLKNIPNEFEELYNSVYQKTLNSHSGSYIETYKNEIIAEFVSLLNSNLKYNSAYPNLTEIAANYEEAEFNDSLANSISNRLHMDDYIDGFLYDNIFIQLSDIKLQSITNNLTIDIFKGLFLTMNLEKSINYYIRITSQNLNIFNNLQNVELNNSDFEKIFNVYSNNKILAAQLINNEIMQELINFYNMYKLEFEIVIKNKKIFIKFYTGPMFEPGTWVKSMDKKYLYTYYCILNFISNISQKINKNIYFLDY